MDLSVTVAQFFANLPPDLQFAILAFLGLSWIASQYVSKSDTPAPNTPWGRFYTFLEVFGGVYGKAKQVGVPATPPVDLEGAFMAEMTAAGAQGRSFDIANVVAALRKTAPAVLLLISAVALSGCAGFDAAWSGANTYYAGEMKATQRNIQGVNDNAAATWADAGCAIPYGELVRNGSGNPNMPAAVVTLCGAPSGFTMTHTVPTTQAIQVPTVQMPAQVPAASVPGVPLPTAPSSPVSLGQPATSPSIAAQAKAASQQMLAQIQAKRLQ